MAVRCPKCGREYETAPKFCGTCGTVFGGGSVSGGGSPVSGGKSVKIDMSSFDMASIFGSGGSGKMPNGIAMGMGEQVVKQYKIGQYTLRQGSIDVIVTNKRVIRYEESHWMGMQTNCIDEINIDAVHGTSCTMMRSISVLGLIFCLVLLIFGISLMTVRSQFGGGGFPLPGIICLIVAALVLIKSFKPTLLFSLHGSVGGPALETNVNVLGRLFGKNYSSVVFQFKPTNETTVMLKEIGACIYDLKVLGDKAIDKWK